MANVNLFSISATITGVNEKFLCLSSPELPEESYIKISAKIAMISLGRQTSPIDTRLADEFQVGDMFHLEVSRDTNYYIPGRIHAMKLFRTDSVHVIGDGLVIDIPETMGPIIRTAIIPDFCCPKDRCLMPANEIKKGDTVHFEAVVIGQTIEGRWLTVLLPDSRDRLFPMDRKRGVVCKNQVTGNFELRFCKADATITSIPLYPGAYFGCGAPAEALLGQSVIGTICPRQPHLSSTDLQVIYFEPDFDSVVPRNDRMLAAALDSASSFGTSVRTTRSYHEVQSSRYYNEDTVKMLCDSFLYAFDHSDPEEFENLIRRHPKLVSVVLRELGIGDGAIYEGTGDDLDARLNEIRQGRPQTLPTQEYERLDSGNAPMAAATFMTPQFTNPTAAVTDQQKFSEYATASSEQRREPVAPDFHPSEVFGPDASMDEVIVEPEVTATTNADKTDVERWLAGTHETGQVELAGLGQAEVDTRQEDLSERVLTPAGNRVGSAGGQSEGSVNDSWTAGNYGQTQRQVTHLRGKIKPG